MESHCRLVDRQLRKTTNDTTIGCSPLIELMHVQVEGISTIPDLKTAYTGHYHTLLLPIRDLKKRGGAVILCKYKDMEQPSTTIIQIYPSS